MADTFAVYQCDRIKRGAAPENERVVATGFATAGEAMGHANALRCADSARSYTVGFA